jgi:hypothetical protein
MTSSGVHLRHYRRQCLDEMLVLSAAPDSHAYARIEPGLEPRLDDHPVAPESNLRDDHREQIDTEDDQVHCPLQDCRAASIE